MKAHFLTQGYGVPLAFRLLLGGHECSAQKRGVPYGKGLLDPGDASGADVVICDGFGFGEQADGLRAEGLRVLCGGKFAELMNARADCQRSFLNRAGIELCADAEAKRPRFLALWYGDGRLDAIGSGRLYLHLMDGDLGPKTAGVACEIEPVEKNGEPDSRIEALRLALRKIAYEGPITVGLSDDDAITGIHFGIRPLVFEALCEMTPGGLERLLNWDKEPGLWPSDCAIALQISVPPWPYEIPRKTPSTPFEVEDDRHFWPLDVNLEDGDLEYVGRVGILGVATARGRPAKDGEKRAWWPEASYRVLRTAKGVSLPEIQYRGDVAIKEPSQTTKETHIERAD